MPWEVQCTACRRLIISRAGPGKEAQCPNCGKRVIVPGAAKFVDEASAGPAKPSATARQLPSHKYSTSQQSTRGFGQHAAGAVGGIAWLALVLHIIATIIIWGASEGESLIAILVGLGVLLEGIILCVVLRALHWTAKNVAEMRSRM